MKTLKLAILLAGILCAHTFSFAQSGADLFRQNCGACHTVGNGKLVGPDLKGVESRHPMAWLFKWIKSSQALVNSGDKAAVKLFKDNNQIPMPDQALTKEQVTTILGYINDQGGGASATATAGDNTNNTAPVAADSTNAGANNSVATNNGIDPLVMSGTPAVFNKPEVMQSSADDIWQASKWWVLIIIVALIINVSTTVVFESVDTKENVNQA